MTQVRRLAAAAIIVLAPLGLAIVWLLVRDDLPARLATHFGLDGTPDGFQRAGVFAAWLLPLTALLAIAGVAAVVWLRVPGVPGVPGVVGLAGYLTWLFATIGADTLLTARGVADPEDIRLGWAHTLLAIAAGVAAGVVSWRLTPPGPRPELARTTPVTAVAPGERVVWLGSARSRVMSSIAVGLLLVGAVALAVGRLLSATPVVSVVAGSLLLVGLAVGWTREVQVRIDNAGVTARLGGFAWPRWHTPLARIEHAAAEQIEPMQWGGWGYRLSRRGTAIVIRRGPGIVLRRTGRVDLAITVDDAETGAALINGLIAARRD